MLSSVWEMFTCGLACTMARYVMSEQDTVSALAALLRPYECIERTLPQKMVVK